MAIKDIWLARSIRIWHHSHNHIALLLVKLVGMSLQVPDVGNMLTDIGEEIDSGKAGLLVFIFVSGPAFRVDLSAYNEGSADCSRLSRHY